MKHGPAALLGVNVYDARQKDGYITSTYFCMFECGGKQETHYGDFLVKLDAEGMIEKIYRWHRENGKE